MELNRFYQVVYPKIASNAYCMRISLHNTIVLETYSGDWFLTALPLSDIEGNDGLTFKYVDRFNNIILLSIYNKMRRLGTDVLLKGYPNE